MYLKLIYTFLMVIVCTSQGCISDDDPDGIALTVGDKLPQFSVTLSDGTVVNDSSLDGKVGVIVFFNTGCSDCRQELPVIQKLWEEYKDNSNIVIALIAREEGAQEIEKYWRENNLTIPYSPQENKEVYHLFAPSVIPRIYISNPEGVITFSSGDTDMPSLERLRDAVNALL